MISRHLAEHSIDGCERSLYELPHLANLYHKEDYR